MLLDLLWPKIETFANYLSYNDVYTIGLKPVMLMSYHVMCHLLYACIVRDFNKLYFQLTYSMVVRVLSAFIVQFNLQLNCCFKTKVRSVH